MVARVLTRASQTASLDGAASLLFNRSPILDSREGVSNLNS